MRAAAKRDFNEISRHAGDAASLMRALSHAARLKVLCALVGGERSVGELMKPSGLGQSALSQHLAKLREDGLVETRRDGQTIYYRLGDPQVKRVLDLLHELYCRN
ncbi:MAG: helix-turn-helix domain-containing protein [Alphaproteobacteria bacterium]|nr:helix-turn-helix domain-containing protein [Alphaproteobacteria bacterium]MBU6471458.1 helix-turn-helix domain-containing protein [Alphaproteobacteria bacterium]MDE2013854.1 helix-turn-helix transcriptional regulator [Alphaproteobacteria bacterium]MDE2074729.1 helix-turn-helix transcriptional regulator [Alphaproteobacteria bacterium]MDE2350552.1 helix-turn-helix transcriptional regulator [Alphaproteobacteria bacterium]